MRAAVILFPGSNREGDVARALHQASGVRPPILRHDETELPAGIDLVVLPGGFAYGDYLRCGAIAARAPIMAAVSAHVRRGGLALGVCNGFQVLCEAGLLPGVLMRNADLRFICRMQHLRVENNQTRFAKAYAPGQVVKVAIAHGEGNYVADSATVERLEGEGRVAFRYAPGENPNGSARNIAGILSEKRNVLGLMPHPERVCDPTLGGTDGVALFKSLIETLS